MVLGHFQDFEKGSFDFGVGRGGRGRVVGCVGSP